VWKTWFPGMCVAKTCASAPPARMTAKYVQWTLASDAVEVTAAAAVAATIER